MLLFILLIMGCSFLSASDSWNQGWHDALVDPELRHILLNSLLGTSAGRATTASLSVTHFFCCCQVAQNLGYMSGPSCICPIATGCCMSAAACVWFINKTHTPPQQKPPKRIRFKD